MNRFWQALESPTGLEQIRKVWQEELGPDFEAVSGFLRPTSRTVGAYPCPSPGGDGCPRRVVIHGVGEIVAVCNDTPRRCDRVELTRADIVIFEVNVPRLCTQIAVGLGIEAAPVPSSLLARTWSIGAAVPCTRDRLPVYLAMPTSREDFRRIVVELIFGGRAPFLLLTPTSHLRETETLDLIRTNGAHYLALSEILRPTQDGRLFAMRPLAELLGVQLDNARGSPVNVFRQNGDLWEIRYQGQATNLKARRGLSYIAYLLDRPGEEIHCVALYQAVVQADIPIDLDSGGEATDRASITTYRDQLASWQEELDEARAHHDLGRQERIEENIEQVKAQLGSALGLHGRSRNEPSNLKRIRQSVGKAISRAREALKERHPELAAHLERSIRLGADISYSPAQQICWHTS